jgi:hypothetical protein
VNDRPLEDADIAQLVHDVADGWAMPPVRLDAPTWRERVRDPRARRVNAARGWLARLGRAATAAIALTVAATLIAVVITLPGDPGKSPGPSGSTPGATDAAQASPLPRLLPNGDTPSPSRVVVETDQGDFAIVDLAAGSISQPVTGARFGSELQVRADGLLCLCLSEGTFVDDNPTTASVTLERFDADGRPSSSAPPVLIRSFVGAPDPRDKGRFIPDRPPHVLIAMSFSEGGRYGFIGWSERAGSVWQSGVLVVELRTAEVVSELPLPDMTSGDEDSRRVRNAPRVLSSTGGDALVIGSSWYEFSPPDSDRATYTFDTEAFRVSFTGGLLGDLSPVPGMSGCGDVVRFGGALSDGGTWVACSRGGAFQTTLRRVAGNGDTLPDVHLSGEGGLEGDTTALSRDGSTLFAWNPASAMLTKVDVASGMTTTGEGLVARADTGPLAALGRWLAPVAAAKSFLRSSVVVSPDGSRVYAIGVKAGVENPEVVGSAGVFGFDAATLELIDIYDPTADFVSLAIGADGRFVYAAGLPGVDALGRRVAGQGPSITVFDTADGSIRLIAGQLGVGGITFGPEPLR